MHVALLKDVEMVTGDKALGMIEAIGEIFPKVKYQRYTVYFYRNFFSVVPNGKVQVAAKMLKAIHAQEGLHRIIYTIPRRYRFNFSKNMHGS